MLEAAVVHAKPADVLKRQPFVPKKEAPKITGLYPNNTVRIYERSG